MSAVMCTVLHRLTEKWQDTADSSEAKQAPEPAPSLAIPNIPDLSLSLFIAKAACLY